jgi:hydroxymethylpyrimidine pyrophosphatase-like HAD family hydrolase
VDSIEFHINNLSVTLKEHMKAIKISLAIASLTFLVACGDNSNSEPMLAGPISGTVIGLSNGNELVVQNNDTNTTVVSVNGNFSFATPVSDQESYSVTVLTQPTSQICTVLNGNGNGTGAMVNLSINCVPVPYIPV